MATQQRRQNDVIIIIKSSVVKAIHKNIAGEGKGGGGRVGVLMKGQGKMVVKEEEEKWCCVW